MNVRSIVVVLLALTVAGLMFNQWRLQRALTQAPAAKGDGATTSTELSPDASEAEARFQEMETKLRESETQLAVANQQLVTAATRIRQMEDRVQALESPNRPRRMQPQNSSGFDFPSIANSLPNDGTGPRRAWGPEQVAGPPDTQGAGDITTAWASRNPDGGEEWLKLDYERAVEVSQIRIRETYNPGAVSKVTAFLANGAEYTLWEGIEPSAEAPTDVTFDVPAGVNASSIKVYLDTKRIPGWNEIDAVELVGRDGSRQWAKSASASSTYAER